MNSYRLTVGNQDVRLTADYSIRFVEVSESDSVPVLYLRGQRVVKAWTIDLVHDEPADKYGGNANTC